MTPEFHRLASDLFDQVRELPEAARSAALDAACHANPALGEHVLRMLEAHRAASAKSFLSGKAIEDASRLLNPSLTELPLAGAILGNYRVGNRIGAGGMGVVFEAHDLHLDRPVAIKVLPPSLAPKDDERIQRFQREARAASLLNHPNIVSVFDAGFDEHCSYIAMEFVDGQTLRQVVSSPAQIPDAQRLLDWLNQAAAALSAAHQAGIVHRDIKPENIMVRPDGFVKVLDFGLAKLREPDAATSPAADLRTRPGVLAGTIHYLSPEQILGEAAGPRSDLFSLGVVAYELATGVRPFEGPTDGAVFNAILHHQPPPPSAIRPKLGTQLDALILHLLEKDPDLRLQTAVDLRSSCRRISRDNVAYTAPPAPSRPRRRLLLAASAAILCGIAALLFWLTRTPPAPQVTRISRITNDGLEKEYFVTDGTRLYYSAGPQNQEIKLFQTSTTGGADPVPMPQLNGMVPLDISTDGTQLLLGQYGPNGSDENFQLWAAPSLGGAPHRLADLNADDARWFQKGEGVIYVSDNHLLTAHNDGSNSRLLATLSGKATWPVLSPDGATIRLTVNSAKFGTHLSELAANGTGQHLLFPISENEQNEQGAWTPDGKYFVFSAGLSTADLWAVHETGFRHSTHQLRLTAGPLIADHPRPTPDGRHIFFRGRLDKAELVRYHRNSDEAIPFLKRLGRHPRFDYRAYGNWITGRQHPECWVLWRCASALAK